MKSGLYTLAEPLSNPEADARVKHDWTKMDFQPGIFRVLETVTNFGDGIVLTQHEIYRGGLFLTSAQDAGKALLAALTPADHTPSTLFQEEGVSNCHPSFYIKLLDELVERGKLEMSDLEAVLTSNLDEEGD